MIGFIFVSISYLYGTLLTANHNLRQLNSLAALTVVLNMGLNLILIPVPGPGSCHLQPGLPGLLRTCTICSRHTPAAYPRQQGYPEETGLFPCYKPGYRLPLPVCSGLDPGPDDPAVNLHRQLHPSGPDQAFKSDSTPDGIS